MERARDGVGKGTEWAKEIEKARMNAVAGEGSGTNERRGQREEWGQMNAVPGGDGESESLCIRSGIGEWREVGPSTHTQTTHVHTSTHCPAPTPPPARVTYSRSTASAPCVPPAAAAAFPSLVGSAVSPVSGDGVEWVSQSTNSSAVFSTWLPADSGLRSARAD